MQRLLVIGCGYVGRPVAQRWKSEGGSVIALTRGGSSQAELETLGIPNAQGDWLAPTWPAEVVDSQVALIAVPHRPDPELNERTHIVGMENLRRNLPHLRRILQFSTTGVYSQSQGELVDERSAAEPQRIGPKMARLAEDWLREHLPPGQGTSLRLAGIYGPDRIPLLGKLRAGEPIPVASTGYLNLIHLDDIVATSIQLLRMETARDLYVLSDGQPVERREFYREMSRVFGTTPPVFSELDADSVRAQRAESNKRIDPSLILAELKLSLKFPDYRAGLAAIAEGMRA